MLKKQIKKSFLFIFAIVSMSVLLPTQAVAAIHVNPISGIDKDFIKGADVSMLPEIEKNGGKFYENGTTEDCLKILKNNGVNWIRLRIWNNPYVNGQGVGGGNTDEDKALAMTARAKKLGMKVLLDFHYSDFWADPGKQNKPAAWANDNYQKLPNDIYKFTAKVVKDFNAKNLTPDMIQIGNEINNGILWPDGKLTDYGSYKNLAKMISAGLKAVYDNDPDHKIKTMIHIAGCDDDFYHNFFDSLIIKNKINNFDIIGMSFYPFWHGKITTLKSTMDDVSVRYNKNVIVVETAFGFTNDNGDFQKNVYGAAEEKLSGYKSSVQGQATGLRDVMAAVASVKNNRGLGIFYWEPDWIPTSGAGWKTGEGDEWDNLAMFDFKGNALDSISTFKLVSDPNISYIKPSFKSTEQLTVSGGINIPITMPQTIDAIYSDDSVKELPVVWNNPAPVFTVPGTYTITGKTNDGTVVSGNISVSNTTNLLQNGDFETGNLNGWTISGNKTAVNNIGTAGDVRGKSAMHYWSAKSFTFTASQKLTGLRDGKYTLSCWTQGGGGETAYKLFVKTSDEQKVVNIKDIGWNKWHQSVIKDIEVKNGQAQVGLKLIGTDGNWGSIDDVEFYQQ